MCVGGVWSEERGREDKTGGKLQATVVVLK